MIEKVSRHAPPAAGSRAPRNDLAAL